MNEAGQLAAELVATRNRLEWFNNWWAVECERRIKEGVSGRVEIHIYFDQGRIPKIIVNPTLIVSDQATEGLGHTELAASLAELGGQDWMDLGSDQKGLLLNIADNLISKGS